MSTRIEWLTADPRGIEVTAPGEAQDYSDAYGNTADPGHAAIWLQGVCIEGRPDEIERWANELRRRVMDMIERTARPQEG